MSFDSPTNLTDEVFSIVDGEFPSENLATYSAAPAPDVYVANWTVPSVLIGGTLSRVPSPHDFSAGPAAGVQPAPTLDAYVSAPTPDDAADQDAASDKLIRNPSWNAPDSLFAATPLAQVSDESQPAPDTTPTAAQQAEAVQLAMADAAPSGQTTTAADATKSGSGTSPLSPLATITIVVKISGLVVAAAAASAPESSSDGFNVGEFWRNVEKLAPGLNAEQWLAQRGGGVQFDDYWWSSTQMERVQGARRETTVPRIYIDTDLNEFEAAKKFIDLLTNSSDVGANWRASAIASSKDPGAAYQDFEKWWLKKAAEAAVNG
ncbi:MAG: hypothetical protein ACREHD_12590, partial [Pirellulales bacterium]